MATFTASAAQSNVPAFYNVNGTITRVIRYNHSISFSAGDVVQMLRVPNGAVVSAVVNACSVSGGVIVANIGDGNDVSAYGASVVLSGTAINATSMPMRGLGRSYSAEDTIDFVIVSQSATAGGADLILRVEYTLSNSGQG